MKPTQADVLIGIADDAALLFHAPNGTTYADLEVNGHRETWPIRSKGFKRWLVRRFFIMTSKAPGSEALQSALNVIEAKGHFDGPQDVVGLRVSGLNDKLYLDLGDEEWRAVEIDANGWRIVSKPQARFRRAAGIMPLPMPKQGEVRDAEHFDYRSQSRAWIRVRSAVCGRRLASLRDVS